MCSHLSKDSEGLRKFLQFDTNVNTLRQNKAGKAPSSFIIYCSEFVRLQNHVFTADSDGGFAIICEHCSGRFRLDLLFLFDVEEATSFIIGWCCAFCGG